MVITNHTRGRVIADHAETADTSAKRRKGLLGRDKLAAGHALWIVPCESVHTFRMKFPIDIIYLDRRNIVRKVRPAVGPWRLSMCLFAHSVLELPAGVADESGTKVGDQLKMSAS